MSLPAESTEPGERPDGSWMKDNGRADTNRGGGGVKDLEACERSITLGLTVSITQIDKMIFLGYRKTSSLFSNGIPLAQTIF